MNSNNPNDVMDEKKGFISKYTIILFFVLAYAITWVAWTINMIIARGYDNDLDKVENASSGILVLWVIAALTAVYGPAISAVLLTAFNEGKAGLRDFLRRLVKWRVGIQWYLVVLLIPLSLVIVIPLSINLYFGGTIQGTLQLQVSLLAAVMNIIPFIILSGGQEEPGWRGFAQPKLEERFNATIATLIIGTLWFFWHLPLYIWIPYVSQYGDSLLRGLIFQIGIAFLLTWIYNSTKSILMPILFHAIFNFLGRGEILATNLVSQASVIDYMLLMIRATFVMALILLWRYGPERLSSQVEDENKF